MCKISIEGKPNKVGVEFFKDVILFFNKILLKDEKNIDIALHLIPDYKKKKERFGHCFPIISTWFTHVTPRSFAIEMDSRLSQHVAGITLAHEFVHVEQLYLGLLRIPPYHARMTWLGHLLNPNEVSDVQPFEIDARGRELYLWEQYLKQCSRSY